VPLPQPLPGLVLHYSYLWHDERHRGREEGIKNRPCVIVSAAAVSANEVQVMVVPVTHRPPRHPDDAIEMPAITKQRLGMDDARSWIVVTELNRFRWPGPDLRPIPGIRSGSFAYGIVPPKLFSKLKAGILESARKQTLLLTSRSEPTPDPA